MYLVTGGAGFIGSNIVAALCARGAEVMVVDRLREGQPGREKWRNIARHPIAGILPPEELEDFWTAATNIDAVIHMGAISATTATDGDLVAATNLTLPLWLWQVCAERGVPLIYASSAATYGDGTLGFEDDPRPEALAALRPLNLYGWSKLAFDRRVTDMLGRGIPAPSQWAGLRFFNVYGPNEYHKGRMASVVFHKFHEVMSGSPSAAKTARARSRKERARPEPTLNRPETCGFSSSQSATETQSSTWTKSRICAPSATSARSERNSVAGSPRRIWPNLPNTTLAMRPLWYSFGP